MRIRRSRFPRVAALLIVTAALLATVPVGGPPVTAPLGTGGASPGAPAPTSRTTSPAAIGGTVPVAPGFLPPVGTTLVGPPPAGTSITVLVGLESRDPSGFAAAVASEYAPGTPTYRHFLAPSTVAARFGPTPTTVTAARAFFGAYGLSAEPLPGGALLSVVGPASAVGRAFSTTLEEYRSASGRLFLDHPAPAVLPADLPWTGAYGLDTAPSLTPLAVPLPRTGPAGPGATTCASGTGGLAPCQLQTAYAFSPLLANGTNGSGVSIGIVDAYSGGEPESSLASDLATFSSQFGLPTASVNYAYPVPTNTDLNSSTTNPAWAAEEALDLEWAHAAAPGAHLEMTLSPDAGTGLLESVNWLVATGAVNVVTLSWGEPLTGVFNAYSASCPFACNASSDGTYALLGPVFEAAAAEGIGIFAASGDCGAADGTSGAAVNYPAADPYVTGVGGTSLTVTSNGTYVGESAWSGNATGATAPGCHNQGGSGGGYAPLPRPWWQIGLAAAPAGRGVPDVALDAGTAVSIVLGGVDSGVLGTSVATPIWAGIAALADQYAGHSLGFLDPSLYRVAAGPAGTLSFHDTVTGSNGYPAGPGWDPVTGLGSPIVAQLVPQLAASGSVPAARPVPFLFASPRFGPAPLTVSFAVQVTGGTGTYPLSGVSFGDGNSSLGDRNPVHTYPVPGVYQATAFAVDSGGNGSASPPVVIVVGGGTALSVSLSASTTVPTVGASVTFNVSATGGVGPYSYAVTFGDGTFAFAQAGPSIVHRFAAVGGYCAEAIATDAALPVEGGASARLAVAVGGAPVPYCGNAAVPLALRANGTIGVRDAPAEFPTLFAASGGTPPPPGLSNSVAYRANDPYANACGCAIFRTPGNYTVEGWENDTVNGYANATVGVTVAPPLVAAFTASATSGPVPFTVRFSASVSGGYAARANATRWILANGTVVTGAVANLTFTNPGEELVIASVGDGGYGNASEAFLLDAEAPGGSGGSPGIVGNIAPAVDVVPGTTLRFSAAWVGSPHPGNATFLWNLGGGDSAVGPSAEQTYFTGFPSIGSNQLLGSVETLAPNGTVLENLSFVLPHFWAVEPGGFLPRADALGLTATLAPLFGPAPLAARGSAIVSGPGTPSVSWAFGGGAVAVGASVAHSFLVPGNATATATAADRFGDQGVASFGVRVLPSLAIAGEPLPPGGSAPLTVRFSAVASGGYGPPYTYRWTFGGGTVQNGSSVTRTYSIAGTYSATVIVTDARGSSASRNWTVEVRPPGLPVPILLGAAAAVGGLAAVAVLVAARRRRPRSGGPVSP